MHTFKIIISVKISFEDKQSFITILMFLSQMYGKQVRIRWLTNNNHGCEEESIPAPRWSAWDRLQPLISDEDLNVDRSLKTWMRSERMRTSSPELCRRSETCATFPPLFALGLESELVADTPINN